MNVREATDDDVGAIQRVAERAWEQDYPDILSRETAVDGVHEWYSEDSISRELDRADARIFVAEHAGTVAGFVHTVVAGEEGDILRVYVDPDHRGEGGGSSLVQAAVEQLRAAAVDRVQAMVLVDNEAGNEFYDAQGFEPASESHETEIGGEFYGERVWVMES
jgi:ribosomal protein S18 acetylase RimI-like enzyme